MEGYVAKFAPPVHRSREEFIIYTATKRDFSNCLTAEPCLFHMRAPVVVVNLCGAPATGKSTIAGHLLEVFRPEAGVLYISYDRIERGKYEKSEQKPLWERETWRWARIHAIHILSDLLQTLRSDGEGGIAEDILSYPASNRENKPNVVIVDDTMHLRSMRHSVMKLCQICILCFCD